ncbi:MAG: hypothetical protein ACTSPK_00115 [Candidatus Heimdallarchaeota archaeon]
MAEIKNKIAEKIHRKRDKSIRTIIMPDELGGKTYKIKKSLPYNLYKKLVNAYEQEDSMLPLEIVLKYAILEPKITQEILDSDDTDGLEMTILAQEVMEILNITEDRINELKKKVVKR